MVPHFANQPFFSPLDNIFIIYLNFSKNQLITWWSQSQEIVFTPTLLRKLIAPGIISLKFVISYLEKYLPYVYPSTHWVS